MILKTSHLKKYYGREESLVKALDDVNLTVEKGQFAAIIGTSGSGKSTLLNLLGGLDHPTSGGVEVEGKNIGEMTEEQLTVFRRKRIGFIFQNYNLIPYLTAYENIVLPVRLDGKREDRKFLEEAVHFLELEEKLSNYPSHLSGGQQQRVAIARALASDASVILADEPTGNLDEDTAAEIMGILKECAHVMKKCVIVVTHSNDLAKQADVVFRLKKGELLQL